mmetsp:Transcript_87584/g.272191  ORF Transcript_87584/g.272191 Transcript_87584/m.272191 type:complete len:363 (+) Transcript_87584:72-1160(+)
MAARRGPLASRSRSLGRCGRDVRYADQRREPSRGRHHREADWGRGDDRAWADPGRRGGYPDDHDAYRRGSYREDRDPYRSGEAARGAREDGGGGRDAPYRGYPSRERRDEGRWQNPSGGRDRSWGRQDGGERNGGGKYGRAAGEGRHESPLRRPHPPRRSREPSLPARPARRDRSGNYGEERRPRERSPYRERSPAPYDDGRACRGGRASPARRRAPSPSLSPPPRQEKKSPGPPPRRSASGRQEEEEQAGGEAGEVGEGKNYFGAAVVDGVPRQDKRPTWRAEIYLPRPGAPLVHRDRGSVCIRGPNRFNLEEAEDDLVQCKQVAEESGEDAAKQVRALASRLKTSFERQKHIESGHAAKD